MFKILVAPASYKGSIAAHKLSAAIASVCLTGCPQLDHIYGGVDVIEAPIADGGDDTLTALFAALGGHLEQSKVLGPVGKSVASAYLLLDSVPAIHSKALFSDGSISDRVDMPLLDSPLALVELATASGIAYLTNDQLDPLSAHTYGTGQLIESAIARGAKRVVLAVGGSASTDGGTGALCAMGAKFLDKDGRPVPLGGGGLSSIARIDLSQLHTFSRGVDFIVATDVSSPLLGPLGAASVFAPQKGADTRQVELLDNGLAHLAYVLAARSGPERINSLKLTPGAGAAGGAAFGFAAMLGARIVSGFHLIANLLDLKAKVAWCDLIIVAEGRLDKQSVTGKGVGEIVSLAAMMGKNVLALPALCDLTESELAAIVGARPGQIVISATAPTAVSGSVTTDKMATLEDVKRAALLGLNQVIAGR